MRKEEEEEKKGGGRGGGPGWATIPARFDEISNGGAIRVSLIT